ncbi:MAG: sulfite exporter TauE/SafE family protein, partial [Chloroflexota bacterium]|nr:sulfite exporter TauE/SafE family protein [Chloroflexota bacterium]
RTVVDRWGQAHTYRTNLWAGVGLSFLVGFVASLLGLGGGIIHVPVLITVLQFPVHIATATSHFVLVITAFSASITHLFAGAFSGVWGQVLLLALGVVPGAQIGARLSRRLKGTLIMRLLALALLLVGLRLVIESIVRLNMLELVTDVITFNVNTIGSIR